ncbi:MAG: hypothetical protein LBK22_09850 [Tannerella sp.]|jgi:hypothetical protein|nr:hypothetical protein [Tannerella sp.]
MLNKSILVKRALFLCCLLHVLCAGGQEPDAAPCERVYLQTDKSVYLSGETVYLKTLTLTDGKLPLSFSKVAYVELVSDTFSLVQIQTALHGGAGQGILELPPDIPSGYYRLVAYTQWMRNEMPETFFEKQIAVLNARRPLPLYGSARTARPAEEEPDADRQTAVLHTGKPRYATREQGTLHLTGLPGNVRTLSVSIAGLSPSVPDGRRSDRLQTAVFTPFTPRLSGKKYLPEYEGPVLSGKLTPLDTEEVPATGVTAWLAVPGSSIRFFTGKNENGNVRFLTAGIRDVTEIVTSAADEAGHRYQVDIESPFVPVHPAKPRPELRVDSLYAGDLTKRYVAQQVTASVSRHDTVAGAEYSCFDLLPVKTYLLEEYTRFPGIEEVITEYVQGVRFQAGNGGKRLTMAVKPENDLLWIQPLVTLDGIPLRGHDVLAAVSPLLIKKIDVYPSAYVFGETVFKGVIAFSTFRCDHPGLQSDPSYRIRHYAWPAATRPFQAPDYTDESVRRSRHPDFRHTLLWEPDIRTDGRTALDIPFFTSDLTGDFAVTVEGVTDDGRTVYARAFFRVE